MGGKRLTLTDDDDSGGGGGDGGGRGGPRVTAEKHDDERPILDTGVDAAGKDGTMDPDALNAALLAAQADAAVSRAGLHRMLSARQRKPLREDSNPLLSREGSSRGVTAPKAENNTFSDGGGAPSSRGAAVMTESRHRRCMTMNDLWVSNSFRRSWFVTWLWRVCASFFSV